MIFLTYNDNFSGIYKSQVADVCAFISENCNERVRLIAFISIRNFKAQKKLIKEAYENSTVIPMFPKARFWKWNTINLFFTCLLAGEKKIWARGPFAANMALSLKKPGLIQKLLFDARGAYKAELNEYDVVGDEKIKASIAILEKKALGQSNAQLAVSAELKRWWKDEYDFTPKACEVIPCTLSDHFQKPFPTAEELQKLRKENGFNENDIVLIYSGSSAGWQSFELVDEILFRLFSNNNNAKLIFLSNHPPLQSKTFKNFSERILTKWLKPGEVRNVMLAADYGLLLREESITNKVSSPVKFAEYLACGLQVIISPHIGDFSSFVKENDCGIISSAGISIPKASYQKKEDAYNLSQTKFLKENYAEAYKRLLSYLG